jgi:hypothetical protein
MNANPDTFPAGRGATTTAAPSPDQAGPNPTWLVVACTAHRDVGADDVPWLTETITNVAVRLYDHCGTRIALSGFARQGDLLWADAAVRAGMRLWACIPHDGQADRFSKADRAEWTRLRGLAERVFVAGEVPADTPPKQRSTETNKLIWKRNHAMVDVAARAAGGLVTVWDGRLSGGTHGTLIQAAKRNLPGVRIDPKTHTVTGRLPTLAELEPFAVYHPRCGHVRMVALRADADRELARVHTASHRAWRIRRAKPREDTNLACTACYIHPNHLEEDDAPDDAVTQEALL